MSRATPPASGPQPPPVPPARPDATRVLPIVLAAAAAVALLCCGGAAVTGLVVWRAVGWNTGPARATTDAYLDDLEHGDTASAYDRLCAPLHRAYTGTEYDLLVRETGLPTGHRLTGGDRRVGDRTVEVTALLSSAAGTRGHTFTLVREGGTWRVCGQPY